MSAGGADVVIAGGGLIGCALAAELARRGRSVIVVEKAEPGAEASGAAAGMLSPQSDARSRDAFFDLAFESYGLFPAWTQELSDETGVEVGYRRTGLLLCRDEEDAGAGSDDALAWQRAAGLSVERLSREALARAAGGRLSARVQSAIWFPEEGAVDPRSLTQAAWRAAVRRGAEVRTGTSVRSFRIEGDVCRGLDTDSGPIEADATVDAAGAWAAFPGQLPLTLPVEPVRGQIVELSPSVPLDTIVAAGDVYVVPRPGGTALVGSTLEHVGFRKAVTPEALERLRAAAVRLVPDLASARLVTSWSGLRPGTPDGWPILGHSPVRGLFFAAGHFRNGILLAPVTARCLADLLCGCPARDLSAFSIGRFAPAPRAA